MLIHEEVQIAIDFRRRYLMFLDDASDCRSNVDMLIFASACVANGIVQRKQSLR